MNSLSRPAVAIVMALIFGGCASSITGTKAWFDSNNAGKKTLAERASFDLGCPANELQFTCIGPSSNCTSVGVSGCDKKAVYMIVGSAWVMNSDSSASGDATN